MGQAGQRGHFVPGLEGPGMGRLTHSERWRGGERTLGNLPLLAWAAHPGVGAEVKNNFRLCESGRGITAWAAPCVCLLHASRGGATTSMPGWKGLARVCPQQVWPAQRGHARAGTGIVLGSCRGQAAGGPAGAPFVSRWVPVSVKVLGQRREVYVKWNRTSKQFRLCGWFWESPFSKSKSKALIERPAPSSFSEMTVRARCTVSCDLSCVAMT